MYSGQDLEQAKQIGAPIYITAGNLVTLVTHIIVHIPTVFFVITEIIPTLIPF
jgi:hypothetical protein